MVGLDDLATLFQLQVREDAAARAITATYKNQTIVLTPDQSLVSSSGRLVSLPAPVDAPQQPMAGARRIHQPRARAHLRCPARLPPRRAPARHRRSARAARDGAVRRRTCVAARDVRDHAASARRPSRRSRGGCSCASTPTRSTHRFRRRRQQQLLTGIRATEPTTIQMDLGQRFSTFRASPPISSGAAAVLTVELLAAGADTSSAAAAYRTRRTYGAPNAPACTCCTDRRSSRSSPAHRVRRSARS